MLVHKGISLPHLTEQEKQAQATPGLKVGLLGGSFNPAHDGHLGISRYAIRHLGLDQVWWLVSPQNPLKSSDDMAPLEVRLAGARKIAANCNAVLATDIETRLGTRYTVDTILKLKELFSEARFVWLMGADNLETFDRWHRWQDIFASLPIAVFRRPGYACDVQSSLAGQRFAADWRDSTFWDRLPMLKPPVWVTLDNPEIALSATEIRIKQQGETDPCP